MTDSKQVEIKTEVTEYIASIKKLFPEELPASTVVTLSEAEYEKFLPEGVTLETVNQINDTNVKLLAAGIGATGEYALPLMQKDPALNEVGFVIKAGKSQTIEGHVRRSQEVTNLQGKPGEKKVVFGHSAGKIAYKGIAGKAVVRPVRKSITEAYATAFDK